MKTLLEKWGALSSATLRVLSALGWTDFQKDDHTTVCAYLVTNHGKTSIRSSNSMAGTTSSAFAKAF